MKIGIGIDTGGTYTDAVVYDYEKRQLLASASALTTKEDLSLGIGKALDAAGRTAQKAELAALSTSRHQRLRGKQGGRAVDPLGRRPQGCGEDGDAFRPASGGGDYFQPSFVGPDGESPPGNRLGALLKKISSRGFPDFRCGRHHVSSTP